MNTSLSPLQRRRFLTLSSWINRSCLAATVLFIASYFPISALWPLPASGGDLGSHFWPFSVFMEQGLRHWSLRSWNPGNLFGEPHFLNYFPFPYFVMALLALALPVGTAFNIGVLLPVLALPFAAYFFVVQLRQRFPAPLFAACASLLFLFNESYSMWGGNFLSVLAGQFAHSYGLVFLLLGWGVFQAELREKRFPLRSSLLLAAAFTSHAYIALGIPWCLLGSVLGTAGPEWKYRFRAGIYTGLLVLGLTAWFWIPFLSNSMWTTAFSVEWRSGKLLEEFVPTMFMPLLTLALISLTVLLVFGRKRRPFRVFLLFLPLMVGYVIYYGTFSQLGLVDVRALPQLQLFGLVLFGIIVSGAARAYFAIALPLFVPVLLVLTLWWVDVQAKNLPQWLDWDFSGWPTKPLYPALTDLSANIRGDFSQPRVAYEHSVLNNQAGSVRVFEMLPYFSGRATLESVYLQASPAAPIAFLIQALISKTPSCPFRQFACPHFDLASAEAKLKFAGVDTLILSSDELISQANEQSYLLPGETFGPWHLYKLQDSVSLVEVPAEIPQVATGTDWKSEFFNWFATYSGNERLIWVPQNNNSSKGKLPVRDANRTCHPMVKVGFNFLSLHTDCIGVLHVLKFSYSPSWTSETGERLEIVSPGFIGVVPAQSDVRLVFGENWLWKASLLLSAAVLAIAVFIWRKERG